MLNTDADKNKDSKIDASEKVEEVVEHSWHILVLLVIGLFIGLLLVGANIEKIPMLQAFDRTFYGLIHGMPRNALLDALILPVNYNFLPWGAAKLPSFLYFMAGGLLIYLALFDRKMLPWAVMTIVIGTMFVGMLFKVTSTYVFRERPFTKLENRVDEGAKAAWKNWTSFPSGHTRETAMYAAIIASYIPVLRIPMLVFAVFVAFSRVYLGAHYPTDVITGLLVGYLAAKVALIASREVQIALRTMKGKFSFEVPTLDKKPV